MKLTEDETHLQANEAISRSKGFVVNVVNQNGDVEVFFHTSRLTQVEILGLFKATENFEEVFNECSVDDGEISGKDIIPD